MLVHIFAAIDSINRVQNTRQRGIPPQARDCFAALVVEEGTVASGEGELSRGDAHYVERDTRSLHWDTKQTYKPANIDRNVPGSSGRT